MGKIKETLVDAIIYSVLMAEVCNLNIDQIHLKIRINMQKHPNKKVYGIKIGFAFVPVTNLFTELAS